MRIILSFLLMLLMMQTFCGCTVSQVSKVQDDNNRAAVYQIVIMSDQSSDVNDILIDLLFRSGLMLTEFQQDYFSTAMEETRISITAVNSEKLNSIVKEVKEKIKLISLKIVKN